MKSKIAILIALVFFSMGCEDQQTQVVVLKTHEFEYYSNEEVDKPAIITDKSEWKKDNAKMLKIGKKIKKQYVNFPEKIAIHFSVFVNEDGEITFIKNLKRPALGSEIIVDELLHNIGELLSKRNITPAIKDGKAVKYRREIKIGYETKSDSLQLFIPDFIGKMSEFNFNIFDKSEFYVAAEEMPQPIGGIESIQKKIHYPEIAKRAGIEGRVYVKAYIDTLGNVVETEIIRGIGAGCDEAAIKAVEATKFNPGKLNGKSVNVQVSIPILFKLQ
jgi:TonB family protein